MTAGFDPPAQDWLAGHRGVDFAALPGTPVRAVAAGVVAFAGPVAGRPVVVVRLPDGRRTTYEPVRALVGVGEQVAAGATLGVVVDRAGSDPDPAGGRHCASGCLHLGLRTATGYADPLSLLTRPPAVLKPL